MKRARYHQPTKRSETKGKKSAPLLPASVQSELLDFMTYHSAKEVSKNLRKMLLEFLMHRNAIEALYLKDLLYDLEGLFDLLDVIDTESEHQEYG